MNESITIQHPDKNVKLFRQQVIFKHMEHFGGVKNKIDYIRVKCTSDFESQ